MGERGNGGERVWGREGMGERECTTFGPHCVSVIKAIISYAFPEIIICIFSLEMCKQCMLFNLQFCDQTYFEPRANAYANTLVELKFTTHCRCVLPPVTQP